jgi:hypothetical protein
VGDGAHGRPGCLSRQRGLSSTSREWSTTDAGPHQRRGIVLGERRRVNCDRARSSLAKIAKDAKAHQRLIFDGSSLERKVPTRLIGARSIPLRFAWRPLRAWRESGNCWTGACGDRTAGAGSDYGDAGSDASASGTSGYTVSRGDGSTTTGNGVAVESDSAADSGAGVVTAAAISSAMTG